MDLLEEYGWNEAHATNWKELQERYQVTNAIPGRVPLEHKRMYRVITTEGEWLSVCSGSFEYEASERRDFPAVGDWVMVEKMPGEMEGALKNFRFLTE